MSIYLLYQISDQRTTLHPVAELTHDGVVVSFTTAANMLLQHLDQETQRYNFYNLALEYALHSTDDNVDFYRLNCMFSHLRKGTGEVLAHVGVISGQPWFVAIVLSPGSGIINTFLIDAKGVCDKTYDCVMLTNYTERIMKVMNRAIGDEMSVRVQEALQDVYANASINCPANQCRYVPPCLQNLRAVLRTASAWTLPTLPIPKPESCEDLNPNPKAKRPLDQCRTFGGWCIRDKDKEEEFHDLWRKLLEIEGEFQANGHPFDLKDIRTWPTYEDGRVPKIYLKHFRNRSELQSAVRAARLLAHPDRGCNANDSRCPDEQCCRIVFDFMNYLLDMRQGFPDNANPKPHRYQPY